MMLLLLEEEKEEESHRRYAATLSRHSEPAWKFQGTVVGDADQLV